MRWRDVYTFMLLPLREQWREVRDLVEDCNAPLPFVVDLDAVETVNGSCGLRPDEVIMARESAELAKVRPKVHGIDKLNDAAMECYRCQRDGVAMWAGFWEKFTPEEQQWLRAETAAKAKRRKERLAAEERAKARRVIEEQAEKRAAEVQEKEREEWRAKALASEREIERALVKKLARPVVHDHVENCLAALASALLHHRAGEFMVRLKMLDGLVLPHGKARERLDGIVAEFNAQHRDW